MHTERYSVTHLLPLPLGATNDCAVPEVQLQVII